MATVIEGVLPKSSVLLCVFLLWTKGPNANNIHKEIILGYDGKCLSRKAVNNLVEKLGKFSVMTKSLRRRCEVAETTVTRLLCCGFRRTGEAMG
jgi:hypothetical protein